MAEPNLRAFRTSRSGVLFQECVLRPGWGILLLAILVYLLNFAAMLVFLHHGYRPHLVTAFAPRDYTPQASALFAIFFATYLLSLMEHRTLADYGFAGSNALRLLATGITIGGLAITLLIAVLYGSHLLIVQRLPRSGSSFFYYAVLNGCIFFFVAYLEESLFRGYLQYSLTRGLTYLYRRVFGTRDPAKWAFWTSAALLSLAFGLTHFFNANESRIGVASATLFGVVMCAALWRTGSLWWAIGFHTAWSWMQAFLFGTSDSGMLLRDRLATSTSLGDPQWSGGLTGPEGSLLSLLVLLLVLVVLPFPTARNAIYPDLRIQTVFEPAGEMRPDPDA